MDILSSWPGRLLLFLLAFPVLMLGVPFLIAAVRQKLNWDKRQPADAATIDRPATVGSPDSDTALGDLLRQGKPQRFTR